jgi:hypothetical protein
VNGCRQPRPRTNARQPCGLFRFLVSARTIGCGTQDGWITVKRTKDWANRAQQAADQMDESYRQHHEGLRASHAQPGLFEGLIADSQAAFERSQALENALSRSYGFASYYAARAQLRRAGRVRGPDGVVVAIRCVNVGKVRADRPAPPARWPRSRIKRLVAMVGYYATLAPKLRKSHYVWGTYASTQSGPLVEVARRFPRRDESVLYGALLARQVRAEGVEALRRDDPLSWLHGT